MPRRLAFLCGFNKYSSTHFRILRNAVSDAREVKNVLEAQYGFTTTLRTSSDGIALKDSCDKFLREARDAEVALFYFAGHGVRVETDTYFIPNRVRLGDSLANFLDQCLPVERLINDAVLRCRQAKRIFIFDCCRKPFDEFKDFFYDSREHLPRKVSHKEGVNDIIIHAARLDASASDGIGGHSPFCAALLQELKQPTKKYVAEQLQAVSRRAGQNHELPFVGDNMFDLSLLNLSGIFRGQGSARQPLDQGMNITDVSLSADGNVVAVAAGKTTLNGLIRCINIDTRRTMDVVATSNKVDGFSAKPYCAELNEAGSKVAYGCWDGTIGVWLRREKVAKIFKTVSRSPVNSVAWSTKGNYIVAGRTDGEVLLFDAAGRSPLARGVHGSDVWSVCFHKDGSYFVTGSRDGTCRLWCPRDLDPLGNDQLLPSQQINIGSPVRTTRFSRDGQLLVVGTQDARLRIYRFFPPTALVELPGVRHVRQGGLIDDSQILRDLLKNPADKQAWDDANDGSSEARKRFLDKRVFILSADISDDGKVVAFGTNIDGFFLYDLETGSLIGSMRQYLSKWGSLYWRIPAIRLDTRSGRLIAGNGRKVLIVDFHEQLQTESATYSSSAFENSI
jgi:caspase domain-containing protein/WD40 domain-containing protein